MIAHDHYQVLVSCMHSIHKFPLVYVGTLPMIVHLLPTWPWPNVMQGASSDNLGFIDRVLNIFQVLGIRIIVHMIASATLAEINERHN